MGRGHDGACEWLCCFEQQLKTLRGLSYRCLCCLLQTLMYPMGRLRLAAAGACVWFTCCWFELSLLLLPLQTVTEEGEEKELDPEEQEGLNALTAMFMEKMKSSGRSQGTEPTSVLCHDSSNSDSGVQPAGAAPSAHDQFLLHED